MLAKEWNAFGGVGGAVGGNMAPGDVEGDKQMAALSQVDSAAGGTLIKLTAVTRTRMAFPEAWIWADVFLG